MGDEILYFPLRQRVALADLLATLEETDIERVYGPADRQISGVANLRIEQPMPNSSGDTLAFCSQGTVSSERVIDDSTATVIICPPSIAGALAQRWQRTPDGPKAQKTLLASRDPRLAFALAWRAIELMQDRPKRLSRVQPTIDEGAFVARRQIGPNCVPVQQ